MNGKPYDNAVVESFFSVLKKEELYRVRYRSEADLRASLSKYVSFYNGKRSHKCLNHRTPEQAEVEFGQIAGK
ncbi:MAG: integrase core domain-containing protein [Clostridiales bacterium]|nr:integrase core domain-containing protein [Clostridiales bacterium]